MKAVVLGGTGATGLLLQDPKWSSVISIARREADLPEAYKTADTAKLQQRIINMDNLAAEGQGSFEGADVVFCTLGNTRAQAGSAQTFLKVNLDYVREAAKLAKEAGVPHFSLMSAQGANPNVWASNFAPAHPLLYTQTKGKAEEVVKDQGFQRTSIFRAGLLDRMTGHKTFPERIFGAVVRSIKVSDVAHEMILDAEKSGTGLKIYEAGDLLKAAQLRSKS